VRSRAPVASLGPCRTRFRVWPTDLDVFRHMNNGIYLTIMDIARLDLLTRSGVWKVLRARDWYPVVVAETVQFRRSLNLFERFEIETRVLGWDDKAILIEQQFFRGDEAVAHALVRARILKTARGPVTPQELALATGYDPASPALSDYAALWNAEQAGWKGQKRTPNT
jgi:YbgC/YbaW family acyl-CoA thioester hydrolase